MLHATWNALLARERDVRAATSVALAVAVVLWPVIVAGVLSFLAYALALAALELAPAATVAAVRETSILFAVALGAILLRERVSVARVAGATFTVSAVALVALG